jgi:hypothetical protein
MLRLSLTALLAVAVTASAAPCQQRIEVAPGTRVRLTVPTFVDGVAVNRSATTSVGTIVGIDSTSITARMENGGGVQTLPFNVLTHVEISRGRVSAGEGRRRGAIRGALIGGGLTASTYALYRLVQVGSDELAKSNCDFVLIECPAKTDTSIPLVLEIIGGGIAGGALVGVTIGSWKRERWQRVSPRSLEPIEMPRAVSLSVSVKL